ncbi:MAG: superoxide dismutase family protein [Gemmatimonadales bacterium]
MTSRFAPAVPGLIAALALGCAHGGAGSAGPKPVASGTFRNAAGERVGLATLSDSSGTLRLGVSVAQLSPGPHGLHFHAQGTCTPPDFVSAGPHFNPDSRKHGRLNPDGPHLGDLPNLIAGPDGSADTSFIVPSALAEAGGRSLLQPRGAALVIHSQADDERTDPSGASGERVACAVLEPG